MKTSNKGRKLIEKFEGLILRAYDDYNDKIVKPGEKVRGTLTIGYGHTTVAGPPTVYVGMKIKEDEADKILAADLASKTPACSAPDGKTVFVTQSDGTFIEAFLVDRPGREFCMLRSNGSC